MSFSRQLREELTREDLILIIHNYSRQISYFQQVLDDLTVHLEDIKVYVNKNNQTAVGMKISQFEKTLDEAYAERTFEPKIEYPWVIG